MNLLKGRNYLLVRIIVGVDAVQVGRNIRTIMTSDRPDVALLITTIVLFLAATLLAMQLVLVARQNKRTRGGKV